MNRQEIERELRKHDNTLLGGGFKTRGPWGSSYWRGNTSGWIIAYLLYKYNVKNLVELFAGSGTASDVVRDWGTGVTYKGMDLNPNPVRDDIISYDAVKQPVPEGILDGCDMFFMHPPYSSLININYCDEMWKDTTKEHDLVNSDLSYMDWDKFIHEMDKISLKFFAAAEAGSRQAYLIGDIRRKGKFYSMLKSMCFPGEMEQIICKPQWNCVSEGRVYNNNQYVPIVHEFLVICKKLSPYLIDFIIPTKHELDIRDSIKATWRDVVFAVMQKLGVADLEMIYSEIEGHEKAKRNPNWKAKVRQTLQYGNFVNKSRGVWAIAA